MSLFAVIDDHTAQLLSGGGKLLDADEAKGAPVFEGAALPPGLTKKGELMAFKDGEMPKGWSIGRKEGWLKPLGEKKPKVDPIDDDTETML